MEETSGSENDSEPVHERFCNICRELNLDTTTKDYHEQHPGLYGLAADSELINVLDLAKSAAAGCRVCRVLYEAINALAPKDRERVPVKTRRERVFYRTKGAHRPYDAVFHVEPFAKRDYTFQLFIPQSTVDEATYEFGVREASHLGCPGLEAIPVRLGPLPRLDDRISFDMVRMWIASCGKAHPQCRLSSPPQLPKRVIYVGSAARGRVRLHTSTVGEHSDYLALSHCWGSAATVPKTLKSTLKDYEDQIPDAVLSRTFHDAIQITRELGFRYIWIDALCVIQDDAEDWKEQAADMVNVYGHAFLTIAAASASNGAGGCFDCRESSDLRLESAADLGCDLYARPHDENGHNFSTALIRALAVAGAKYPLMQRKWCFQERMLSRRMLYYTERELVWECKAALQCQCGGDTDAHEVLTDSYKARFARLLSTPPTIGVSEYESERELIGLWASVVSEYTARQLTYHQDTLPAFSGVARAFDGRGWGAYCAGTWFNLLPASLCWRSTSYVSHYRSSEYVAPSWSWASVVGSVHLDWLYIDPGTVECDAIVYSASCVCSSSDPFGRVEGGKLVLVAAACERKVRTVKPATRLDGTWLRFENEDWLVALDSPWIDTEADLADLEGASIWLLCIQPSSPITRGRYLLVRSNGAGTYRRIGVTRLGYGEANQSMESWPRNRFEII